MGRMELDDYLREIRCKDILNVKHEDFIKLVSTATNKELALMYEEINGDLKFEKNRIPMDNKNTVDICIKKLSCLLKEFEKRNINVNSFRYKLKRRKEKREQEKECARIGHEVLLSLGYLNHRLSEIRKELTPEKIITGYDIIKTELERLSWQKSFIYSTGYRHSEEIQNESEGINDTANDIYDKIINIGSQPRKEIFTSVEEIGIFKKENPRIKLVLEEIWNKLKLSNIETEDDIENTIISTRLKALKGKKIFSGICESQINAFESCFNHILSKNIYEAIRSLSQFVAPYKYYLDEPFNAFDRVCIKTMIASIIKGMD